MNRISALNEEDREPRAVLLSCENNEQSVVQEMVVIRI